MGQFLQCRFRYERSNRQPETARDAASSLRLARSVRRHGFLKRTEAISREEVDAARFFWCERTSSMDTLLLGRNFQQLWRKFIEAASDGFAEKKLVREG